MWIKHRSPLHEMDWAGWALFGLVATAALTVIMTAAQLGGLSRLDLPLILGTLVTEDPDRARVAGFVIYLVVGQGFALGYTATFALLGIATWWLGALLGMLHVAVALSVLVPLLVGIHPRMASGVPGLARPPCWSRPACSASTTARRPGGGHRRPCRLRRRARLAAEGPLRWAWAPPPARPRTACRRSATTG